MAIPNVIERPQIRDHSLNTRISLERMLCVTDPIVEKMVEITAHSAAQTKNTRRPMEKVSGLDLLEITGSGTAVE